MTYYLLHPTESQMLNNVSPIKNTFYQTITVILRILPAIEAAPSINGQAEELGDTFIK